MLTGHSVSDTTREKLRERARQRRFSTNSSAKTWTLISPDGRRFECTNLNNWIRQNIDLFGYELTEENVHRISAGFRVVKRNIKRQKSGQTYKGWTLGNWGDLKNVEKENKNEN